MNTTTNPDDHLQPPARAMLALPTEERIQRLFAYRWVGYPAATAILDQLEDLFTRPKSLRPSNLLISSPTNNGKTTLVVRHCRRHPAMDEPGGERLSLPLLYVQCPPTPDEKRFYHNI